MSPEGKLVLAVICTVVGVVSFFFGDKKLKVRSGVVTKVVFPESVQPYKGKLMGVGFGLMAVILLWQVGQSWL
jgi:hypothetical protein